MCTPSFSTLNLTYSNSKFLYNFVAKVTTMFYLNKDNFLNGILIETLFWFKSGLNDGVKIVFSFLNE